MLKFYDVEECFRVLIFVLIQNNVFYITQNAFYKYLDFMEENLISKFGIECSFLGEKDFSSFTEFTRGMCAFLNDEQIAIIKRDKKQVLRESVFNVELLESTTTSQSLSIFGVSNNKELNRLNYFNNVNDKQFERINRKLKEINHLEFEYY